MYRRTTIVVLLALAPASAAAQNDDLRLVGEVRVRAEAFDPAFFDDTDYFTLLRTRLGVDASLGRHARVFAQIQDARVFGEELSTTEASADQLDAHQAWLQYGRSFGDYQWAVRAGRQEVILGNERLVGAVGWSNTGRAFDGVRLNVGPEEGGSWIATALAATVRQGVPGGGPAASDDDDHVLLGVHVDAPWVEAFALQDRSARYRLWTGVDRTTVGGRIDVPAVGGFTAWAEGAYQLGEQTGTFDDIIIAQDIAAWMLGARLGYATNLDAVPRLGIGVDVLSGDEQITDDEYGAFNTLYATNHKFYGYIDFFLDPAARTRDGGLIDGIASVAFGISDDLALEADVHRFWLHREIAATDERAIGWELDLTVPVRLGAGQQLQLGYSTFLNGPVAPFLGLGEDEEWSHWAYVQATFSFGGGAPPLFEAR